MEENLGEKLVIVGIIAALVISFGLYVASRYTTQEELQRDNLEALNVAPKYSVVSESVNYHRNFEGHLARPDQEGNYPGVVMIHEWWGLNDNIKEAAENLAAQGYVVLAVDLYGEVTNDSARARELSSWVRGNPDEAINNMESAISYLQQNESANRIASLGWCFGGGQSLQISMEEEMDATVIYYGNLVTDRRELDELKGPVLGIFGSEDQSIPVSTVNEFGNNLDRLRIENEIYIYEGVGHAFANPSGDNYAAKETKDAWARTIVFLDKNLKN